MIILSILVAVILLVISLVIFQIIWIRIKLGSIETSYVERSMSSTKTTGSRGFMGLYSVVIDTLGTLRVNDTNRLYYNDVRGLVSDTECTFIIPSVCGSVVLQQPIKINKLGFLVCKSNAGSIALMSDIKKQQTMYIVANGFMMIIGVNDNVSDKVRTVLNPSSAVDVFIIYAIPLKTDDEKCTVQFTPFTGSSTLSDSSNTNNIDMELVLGITSSQKYMPMQLIAYNLFVP
jgi:hypothetical protein